MKIFRKTTTFYRNIESIVILILGPNRVCARFNNGWFRLMDQPQIL